MTVHLNLTVRAERASEQPANLPIPAEVWDVTVTCPHGSETFGALISQCRNACHTRPEDCQEQLKQAVSAAGQESSERYLQAALCSCGLAYTAAKGPWHAPDLPALCLN